mgnify:CR=1 FL=1
MKKQLIARFLLSLVGAAKNRVDPRAKLQLGDGRLRVINKTPQIAPLDIAGDGLAAPGAIMQNHVPAGLGCEVGQFREWNIHSRLVAEAE